MIVKRIVAVCVIGVLFGILERLRPGVANLRKPWSEFRLDLTFFFLVPPVNVAARRIAIFLIVVPAAILLGSQDVRADLLAGRGPVAELTPGLQVVAALFCADFFGYWMHRLFHGTRLWRFHAVHHGSEFLNWLSSVRVHPINDVIQSTAVACCVLALGFPVGVLAGYMPLIVLFGLFLHSNTAFAWPGPLRFMLASPTYHRWHHTSQAEGLDRNFAGLFPVWDLLFGTFFLPADRRPEKFGVAGEPLPPGFLAQLAYPFKRG
jgi:sterol desaturase/sphingolipid hydroxylase (fatty acid hydroxylase superfamily)